MGDAEAARLARNGTASGGRAGHAQARFVS
jgi:hypothetical protein